MSITISAMLAMLMSVNTGATTPHLTINMVPNTAACELSHNVVSRNADKMMGSIVTPDGQPIGDAMVAIYADGNADALSKTTTNDQGAFSLPTPPMAGSYTVHVLRVGYAPVVVSLTRHGNGWSVPAEITMHPIASDLSLAGLGAAGN